MERSFEGLCDRFTGINQLDRRQLRLYSNHCQLTYKDGPLQTGQNHPRCTQACQNYHRRASMPTRAPRLNHYQ